MNTSSTHASDSPPAALPLLHWYLEGARAALFLRPRWRRVQASPLAAAVLTISAIVLAVVLERLYLDAPAAFNWRAIGSGWLGTALVAWACYLVRPTGAYDPNPDVAPNAGALFCMVLATAQIITLVGGVLTLLLLRGELVSVQATGGSALTAIWLLPIAWAVLAELRVVVRGAARGIGPRTLAAAVLVLSTLQYFWLPQAHFWRAFEQEDEQEQSERAELVLTQELMEAQPALLAQRLGEIAPQRPGVIDMYALTFAPYADEDVFRRESEMVSEVITERFDAVGRNMQLVNHVDTLDQWPWATPANLRRAIRHMASVMNRDEDILFLHLTSHGARDGELAAEFWPMTVDSVTPEDLKAWLDEAGIRHRVLSISACYSGSWIEPLADDHSLVMTAADADHTSYGCGRGSELTFYGRALFHEQLRDQTRAFEQAHASARDIIKQREEAVGKSDGYSNPQIHMGAAIRPRLEKLQQQVAR